MSDNTRDTEIVTPAAAAAPAATVVVDGLAPATTTEGIVPDVRDVPAALDQDAPAAPARRGLRAMLPRRSGKLTAGIVLVAGILLFTFVAPFFTQDPRSTANPRFLPPSTEHLLGTNHIGNDIFAQVAYGGQGSLMVGLVAGAIALVLSIVFGIVAGYRGRFTDEALSLVTNIMLVIPGLPLIIVISAYLQTRSLIIVAVILGLTAWPGAAIVLRMQAKSLRARDYVSAARVAGEKTPRIILVEIFPNLLPLLTAQFLGAVLLAILAEAGLSFLGLGPSGSITWGTILNQASANNALSLGMWWWFVPPGLLIALFGCGLALINFSLDEIINPRLRLGPAAVKSVRKARKAGLAADTDPDGAGSDAPDTDGGDRDGTGTDADDAKETVGA
ncbi:ABC transporter permease [Cellulosimicrobium cellulans]|uniref:ABC transporter permease n=1 Tax=Cellulosimicrobium cellulans TaxID=1710 RepID=UPI001EDACC72|nr:ABC transporter permease [Cellulosimicrobium cellulans]